jgi:UDP-N-acetylglucosamine 4-epimerase
VGDRTTLNQLYGLIRDNLALAKPSVADAQPEYRDFRKGDVRHSLADVSKAKARLGYGPTHTLAAGMKVAMPWYLR